MSTYKSEFFSHYYEGKRRSMSHYSLGFLPLWLRFTGLLAPVVNFVMRTPLRKLIMKAGGLAPERTPPRFASSRELRSQLVPNQSGPANMVLFVDAFTKGFRPEVAEGRCARSHRRGEDHRVRIGFMLRSDLDLHRATGPCEALPPQGGRTS